VIDCPVLAASDVGDPDRCLDPPTRADGYRDCSGNTGRDNSVELIADGFRLLDRVTSPRAGRAAVAGGCLDERASASCVKFVASEALGQCGSQAVAE
jgi:hypothetical protein